MSAEPLTQVRETGETAPDSAGRPACLSASVQWRVRRDTHLSANQARASWITESVLTEAGRQGRLRQPVGQRT